LILRRHAPIWSSCLTGSQGRSDDFADLFQELQQGLSRAGAEFPGIQIPVIVGIDRIEPLLDDGEKFVLRQRSVVIGVGRGKFLGPQSACQFASIERPVVIAIQSVERG
jgi:hypothetical protein